MVAGLLTLVLLVLAFIPGPSAQTVEAFVDRDTLHLGETVKFTIKWSGSNSGVSVKLDVLKNNFQVVGTSQRNQIKMIEGQKNITTELITTLRPKHAGKVEIPSFQIGQHRTSPITLKVLPKPHQDQPEDHHDRFL